MTTSILVGTRSAADVQLVKEAVEQKEYQVIPVTSMSLALFLAHKNLPELILCARELVDGDPLMLLNELQADDELKQIPFMVLAQSTMTDVERRTLMSSGA